ncbi:hypothetical protein HKX48_009065 [Thoreauomyces humboldtii]|nr:hypothetical protein HKX48_009065 [Thoreauomyces humboldtii]
MRTGYRGSRFDQAVIHNTSLADKTSDQRLLLNLIKHLSMAFPGGKAEPGETDQQAAERECVEEIGLDLNASEYICLGALDDRNVTPAASTRAVLVLSPYVYLQLVPSTPPLILMPDEIASLHWVPLAFFLSAARLPNRWRPITFPIARHLLPARIYASATASFTRGGSQNTAANPAWKRSLHVGLERSITWLLGSYSYFGVLLPTTAGEIVTPLATPTLATSPHHPQSALERSMVPSTGQSTPTRLLLWGLTLWMTSDLIDLAHEPEELPVVALCELGAPRYSHLDIDWCFGLLHREGGVGRGGTAALNAVVRDAGEGRVRRKPAVAITVRSKLEIYHAIRVSAVVAVTLRGLIAWLVARNCRKAVDWLRSVL